MTRQRLYALAVLALLLAVSSCSGCYYARVGYGQARVLLGRQPIDEVLAADTLKPAEKAKLALVPKMRTFAHERIGLAKNGSYTTFYDTGEKPVSWNITACSATSFTPYQWSFPFVGAASYKGYFDLEHAKADAEELKAQGYDVTIREVGAYSTLGWFDDPVFRRMLGRDVEDLANTIIHELTHATVFRAGDQSFNESVATFVGDAGAREFLRAEYGDGSRELKKAEENAADDAVFTAFIDSLYERLDAFYRRPLPESMKRAGREKIFAEAKEEFEALRKTKMRNPGAYAWFARRELNNAVILGYRHYHTDIDTFEDVYRLCGGDFKTALAVFRDAAQKDAPRDYLAGWRLYTRRMRLEEAETKAATSKAAGEATGEMGGNRGDEKLEDAGATGGEEGAQG